MKNQNTKPGAKLGIIVLLILTSLFFYACYNSVQKTKQICELTLGTNK